MSTLWQIAEMLAIGIMVGAVALFGYGVVWLLLWNRAARRKTDEVNGDIERRRIS